MERESSKECSVSFFGQTKAFCYEIVFRGIQPCLTNQGSEVSEETWGTFCTLWSMTVRF